jgi:hypothetical protein
VKRDVTIDPDGKVTVRARPQDAIARLRRMNLPSKVASNRLTEEERDTILLALLQHSGLL